MLGGVGLAFVIENTFDRSFTTGEDVERRLGIPHIASIPEGGMVG
jgi:capsular polysaccharide biosynthesis protein